MGHRPILDISVILFLLITRSARIFTGAKLTYAGISGSIATHLFNLLYGRIYHYCIGYSSRFRYNEHSITPIVPITTRIIPLIIHVLISFIVICFTSTDVCPYGLITVTVKKGWDALYSISSSSSGCILIIWYRGMFSSYGLHRGPYLTFSRRLTPYSYTSVFGNLFCCIILSVVEYVVFKERYSG